LNETEEEETWVQEIFCDEKAEATHRGRKSPKGSSFHEGRYRPSSNSFRGPQKVDAPITLMLYVDLRWKIEV